jgi:carbonic anhydrase
MLDTTRIAATQGLEAARASMPLRGEGSVDPVIAHLEVMRALGADESTLGRSRLLLGVERFRRGLETPRQDLFRALAQGQAPHTLFITCSDSRIDPNLITSTEPGELFIVRNVGNLVPPAGQDAMPGEGAAVEFAVGQLGVREIVVCAHSGCGAMKALLAEDLRQPDAWKGYSCLPRWLQLAEEVRGRLPGGASPEEAARRNAVLQMERLRSYPHVRDRLAEGTLRLHAWFYDIGGARLEEWDPGGGAFVPLGSPADPDFRDPLGTGGPPGG